MLLKYLVHISNSKDLWGVDNSKFVALKCIPLAYSKEEIDPHKSADNQYNSAFNIVGDPCENTNPIYTFRAFSTAGYSNALPNMQKW